MLSAALLPVSAVADRTLDVVVRGLSRVLIPMFVVGMAGSTIVVAITFVHDLVDFFDSEGENAGAPAESLSAREPKRI